MRREAWSVNQRLYVKRDWFEQHLNESCRLSVRVNRSVSHSFSQSVGQSVGQSARKRNHHLGIDTSPTERANNKRRLPACPPFIVEVCFLLIFQLHLTTFMWPTMMGSSYSFNTTREREWIEINPDRKHHRPINRPTDRLGCYYDSIMSCLLSLPTSPPAAIIDERTCNRSRHNRYNRSSVQYIHWLDLSKSHPSRTHLGTSSSSGIVLYIQPVSQSALLVSASWMDGVVLNGAKKSIITTASSSSSARKETH